MSGLLSAQSGKHEDRSFGSETWVVAGERYSNTAAKFWSAVVDEARALYPDCDAVMCNAPDERPLERRQLEPHSNLGKALEAMTFASLEEAMATAIQELELYGPPNGVRVCVRRGEEKLLKRELPLECVDAELFPFLLVWLLEWSGIPPPQWNNEFVSSAFQARDPQRQVTYDVGVDLRTQEISEGLLERTLTLKWACCNEREYIESVLDNDQ